ncbi:uncharacterized protein LOC110026981 [Phalaenopsis equestris]|uniref:uncharacterized protein LOC110026981 n=1 Tax=Phalaenopsis equestris TaxID=78828 RepID=UPI0009E23B51|nr:uncharacterized protein LOC110026981 [Phalaenopsis equestris]
MKCPAIACLWPPSPPSHRITAVTVLFHHPPSLFTGGSEGSIVRWTLSGDDVRPLAFLCGHAAEIVGLSSCFPSAVVPPASNSMPSTLYPPALLSACADGVLCVWSAGSFCCRRRRKLPPWAGSPSHLVALPSAPRYVCIACSSGEASKSSVLIVDSKTLIVVQTVFHGSMSIGCVKSIVFIPSMNELEKGIFLFDGHGKSQFLALPKESFHEGEGSTSAMNQGSSSDSLTSIWFESGLDNDVPVVAVAQNGNLLSFIFEFRCEFRSMLNGKIMGEISLLDSKLGSEDSSAELNLSGGMFLHRNADATASVSKTHASDSSAELNLSGGMFLHRDADASASVSKTHASQEDFPRSFCFALCYTNGSARFGYLAKKSVENGHSLKDRIVSSSLVLSDDFYSQHAIVYGFYSGEIEVAWLLSPSLKENSTEEDSLIHSNLHPTEWLFSGHRGAVLCLAAHHMSASSSNLSLHRVLMSGSMDCTVCIWNLDSGTLLWVMHHHIAPVKQIILPPPWTNRPWNDCFLSIGEDGCVALVSIETLRVERMFPGHPSYPSVVAWDSRRGYLACLCRNRSVKSDSVGVLYLWDVKTGAQDRIIRGSASHSMLDHFCKGINTNFMNGSTMGSTTSASTLLLPISDDSGFFQSGAMRTDADKVAVSAVKKLQSDRKITDIPQSYNNSDKGKLPSKNMIHDANSDSPINSSAKQVTFHHVCENKRHPIISSCPFPGIAVLEFDLSSLVSPHYVQNSVEQAGSHSSDIAKEQSLKDGPPEDSAVVQRDRSEGYLLRFSLCFLHLWDVDLELDELLKKEMDICKPDGFEMATGILGDRGSMTLMFPGLCASQELWKSSAIYCAMRSLIIVSLAQRMIGLYHSTTVAGSSLAAFYTRNFAETVQDIKPPLLQLLVSFWQDPSEHVRMAARTLFHCAAPRAIPHPLFVQNDKISANGDTRIENSIQTNNTDCEIVSWLESFEIHEWVSCIGGTSQDAMAAQIVVAAALVVWYPNRVKENLAALVADRLVKLVMSMNDRFSSTAAELLAEGMESSWKSCLGPEIPRLVVDIFFQIECLSGTLANSGKHNPSMAANILEALVGILLPSLAMADIAGFLNVIEDQIWSTSSDSPVHLVSLKILVRIVRSSPKLLALYLEKVVNYVLQTMDPSNVVMRKACLKSSILALKEIARVLPMVALNDSSTRLASGDAIGDIRNVTIRVYDLESVTKIKILDASAPLGLPSLLEGTSNTGMTTAISALIFSPDEEGLVAFSENGLLLRWWSLGTPWWEKLSRNLPLVQCTKLIFVPPWEGFSPNTSRSSIMANIVSADRLANSEEKSEELDEADRIRLLLHNLDLSYRLQWVGGRTVLLTRHGQELGTFPL